MRHLQRLFGNGYTPRPGVVRPMNLRAARPRRTGAGWLPLLLVLGLLGPTLAAGASVTVTGGASYASQNTGGVSVVLPQPLPLVNLSQDGHASIGASLQLVKVVELSGATNGSTTPTVVAAAFASRARAFNATEAGTSGVLDGLVANLTVFRDYGLLFPLANSDAPLRPLTPIAPTTLTVTVRATASPDVVNVSATVAHWPWVSSSDVLAVGWEFGVADDQGFAGCAGPHPVTVSAVACGENAFEYGNSTWGWSGFEAVQGLASSGPEAQIQWGTNVSLGGGGSSAVVAGAERTSSDRMEVVYGAYGAAAPAMTFALSYALVAPPVLPTLLHGALLPYVAGIAVAAVVGGVGLIAARRRDRRLLERL